MNDKTLKRLRRTELLELLLEEREINKKLENELSEAKSQLENRELILKQTGSIAEASLELTNIFVEAQKAADIYLDNIRRAAERSLPMEDLPEMPSITRRRHAYEPPAWSTEDPDLFVEPVTGGEEGEEGIVGDEEMTPEQLEELQKLQQIQMNQYQGSVDKDGNQGNVNYAGFNNQELEENNYENYYQQQVDKEENNNN